MLTLSMPESPSEKDDEGDGPSEMSETGAGYDALPLCVPYAPRAGRWRLDRPWGVGGDVRGQPFSYWVPSADSEPCRYLVSSPSAFSRCFRDKRLVFIGDSTARNMLTLLVDQLGQCSSSLSQRLGPDDPEVVSMCSNNKKGMMAHGDWLFKTSTSLGNTTLDFRWAPFVRDVIGVARETLRAPSERGGPDGAVISLGYWTAKESRMRGDCEQLCVRGKKEDCDAKCGLSHALVKEFVDSMGELSNVLLSELSPTNPQLLQGQLVYQFAPFPENSETITIEVVDFLNEAASAALAPLGIPIFDGSWYTKAKGLADKTLLITWDGYHPSSTVAVTLIREHLSYFCGLWWEGDPSGALDDALPTTWGGMHKRLGGGCAGPGCHFAPGGAYAELAATYALPTLVLFLGAYLLRRVLVFCSTPTQAGGETAGDDHPAK